MQGLLTRMNANRFATWPNVPIPTLNGKTPLQAMKTFAGRDRVEALITVRIPAIMIASSGDRDQRLRSGVAAGLCGALVELSGSDE